MNPDPPYVIEVWIGDQRIFRSGAGADPLTYVHSTKDEAIRTAQTVYRWYDRMMRLGDLRNLCARLGTTSWAVFVIDTATSPRPGTFGEVWVMGDPNCQTD